MPRGTYSLFWLALTSSALAQQAPAPPVFGTQTTLIHVDALVTDKKGVPIRDLQAADFEIESNGTRFPAQVATFVSLADSALPAPDLRDGAKPRVEDVRRVVTFLFAFPRIQMMEGGRAAMVRLRTSEKLVSLIRSYVQRWMEPRDLVAIVSMESQRPLLNRPSADPGVISRTVENLAAELLENKSPSLFATREVQDPLARYDLAVAKVAQEAVDRMAALPGRKLFFIVAPTLRLADNPTGPLAGFAEVRAEVEELVRRCNRVGVTMHGIKTSPRGSVGSPPSLGAERSGPPLVPFNAPPVSDAIEYLADHTGGSTFRDLDAAEGDLARVMERNRGYYLLGYDEGREPDGQPRRIRVRVRRSGAVVTTRPIVFHDRSAALIARATSAAQTLEESLDSALAAGDLDVRIRTRLETVEKGASALDIVITIDAKAPVSQGFEVLWRVRDEHANAFKSERTQVASGVDGGSKLVARALLPAAGAYQIDVAVRDSASGRGGNASLTIWTADTH